MHTKGLVFLGTTLLGAALAVACSDEDDPAGPGTNTGDGGTNTPVDSGGGNTDAAKADTGTPDGGGTTYKAITTFKETRVDNAINPYGLTFGQDGNIYVSGSTHQLPGPDQKLAVWRFKADGTLDTAFGTNGVVTVGLAGAETLVYQAFVQGKPLAIITSDGVTHELPAIEPPPRSRPVHPAQIYSAVTAALLAWVLWSFYPFRRRDGEVTALMITLYPIARFFEESIRVDESAVFGTGLSISQNISILLFLTALGMWVWLLRKPAGNLAFPQTAVASR